MRRNLKTIMYSESPLVSAIIPTHNRILWVQESIESVLAQTYQNIEIVVIDDGSTDGTLDFLRQKYGPKIDKIVRNERPTGTGAAKNLGVKNATGEYIAFLDSDDMWEPEKTKQAVSLILGEPNDNIAVVGGGCRYVNIKNQPILQPDLPSPSVEYEDFAIKINMPGSGSNNLIKRSIFEAIGGFDETLLRAQDKDLWLRILKRYEFRFVEEITAVIRIHDTARVNVDIDVILNSRLQIDNKIIDPKLRKKARAYTYLTVSERTWHSSKIQSITFFILSISVWPLPIRNDISRLKLIVKKLIGRN